MTADFGSRPFAGPLDVAVAERFSDFILRVAGTVGGGILTTALLAAVLR